MSGDRIIVKARGLPWSASSPEVVSFFSDCSIIGGEKGVHFGMNRYRDHEEIIFFLYPVFQ